jgi:hypothetical protein
MQERGKTREHAVLISAPNGLAGKTLIMVLKLQFIISIVHLQQKNTPVELTG